MELDYTYKTEMVHGTNTNYRGISIGDVFYMHHWGILNQRDYVRWDDREYEVLDFSNVICKFTIKFKQQ